MQPTQLFSGFSCSVQNHAILFEELALVLSHNACNVSTHIMMLKVDSKANNVYR